MRPISLPVPQKYILTLGFHDKSLSSEGKSSPTRFGRARVQALGFFTACVGLSAVLPIELEPDFHLQALQASRGDIACKYYDGDSKGTLAFARIIRSRPDF